MKKSFHVEKANRRKRHANFALVFVMLAFVGLLIGCAALQRSLYTSHPVAVVTAPGVTNYIDRLDPSDPVVHVIQTTGALFGPYGAAAAGLLTGGLSLYASWQNRKRLANHVRDTEVAFRPERQAGRT